MNIQRYHKLMLFLCILLLFGCHRKYTAEELQVKSVITGKVLDITTNQAITKGTVRLLLVNKNAFDTTSLGKDGSFRFEFTNKTCPDCYYIQHDFEKVYMPLPGQATPPSPESFKYAAVNFLPRNTNNTYGFSEIIYELKNTASVDKSEDVTLYYAPKSKLKLNIVSKPPLVNTDLFRVSITNSIAASNDIVVQYITGVSSSSDRTFYLNQDVAGNKTCTISYHIEKNGQVIDKSMEVFVEPFITKEVNIEY